MVFALSVSFGTKGQEKPGTCQAQEKMHLVPSLLVSYAVIHTAAKLPGHETSGHSPSG